MTTVIEFYIPEKERGKSITSLTTHFDKKICKSIEKGFYDFTEQYCKSSASTMELAQSIYRDHIQNFVYNCEQNNPTIKKLKKMVKKDKYNPYNFAFLRPHELDEENWKKILLRKKTTEETLNNLPTIEWRPCSVCKSVEHFYEQMQTRSADEPMTTFYYCKKCGKANKVNN